MKSQKLVLVGSRQNIKDIVLVANLNGYQVEGILDEHYWGNTDQIGGIPVIGSETELLNPDSPWRDRVFFLADWWTGEQDLTGQGQDGSNRRLRRIGILEQSGVDVVNLIHPDVTFFYGRDAVQFGRGILVLGGSSFADDTVIGDYSVIDWRVGLATDVVIGTNVIVGGRSNLAHVRVGDNARLGVGSICVTTKNRPLTIGHDSVVYIGSTVLDDVPPNSVYTMHHRVRNRISSTNHNHPVDQ